MKTTTFRLPNRLQAQLLSEKSVFLLISFLLAVFLVIRALLVPMAHDEIATFYYFVQSGKVSPFLTNIDTNNHFLNSTLTWIFYRVFGPTPLVLRLSNLIFIPVFFYYLYKITQQLNSRVFRYALFISLALTLHFIEFLSLSRGYGISMALLMASLYYLIMGTGIKNTRYPIFSLISIFLACTANLALINTYALILALTSITLIINNLSRLKPILITIVCTGIIPFSIILIQILYIKSNAGLIAGSPVNFWTTTITSLFAYLFEVPGFYADGIAILLFSVIAVTGFWRLIKTGKIKTLLNDKPTIFLYLLAGNIASILILGFFFKVNYPDDRVGVYLYPLTLFSLVFLLDSLFSGSKWNIAVVLPLLLIPIHFLFFANTTYSIWYKYDVIPERFYDRVMQDKKADGMPPTIAGHGMRIFCWSYLDYLKGGKASPVFFTHFPDYNADYQIVNIKMAPEWQIRYDTIDYDPVSERHLLKQRIPKQPKVLISKQIIPGTTTKDEFIQIAEGKADTLRNKNLKVDFNLSISSNNKPFNARIVFDIWDGSKKSMRYEYIHLSWLRNYWNGSPGNFINCLLVYLVPPEAAEYKIYLWNIEKAKCTLGNGQIQINELQE